MLAVSKLRERSGNSKVDNALWDCVGGRILCSRPLKQSHHAIATSSLTNPLSNSEMGGVLFCRFR